MLYGADCWDMGIDREMENILKSCDSTFNTV